MLYIDTNVFIVYLTDSPPHHGELARAFFHDLSVGAVTATTTEGVLVEVTHVLASNRGLAYPRDRVSQQLKLILGFRGLRVEHLENHLRALDRFATTNLDYVDCLLIESATGADDAIFSFDRDYDRIRPGIRVESIHLDSSGTGSDLRNDEIEEQP